MDYFAEKYFCFCFCRILLFSVFAENYYSLSMQKKYSNFCQKIDICKSNFWNFFWHFFQGVFGYLSRLFIQLVEGLLSEFEFKGCVSRFRFNSSESGSFCFPKIFWIFSFKEVFLLFFGLVGFEWIISVLVSWLS